MTGHDHDHDHDHAPDINDLGLQADLAMWARSPLERRQILKLGALEIGALLTGYSANKVLGSGGTVSAASAAASCVSAIPSETAGPYPADGSNASNQTLNVLTRSGIVRKDIRSSITTGNTAPGLPMALELTLVSTLGDCAPLEGYAVYVWHCTRDGAYSLYGGGITGEDYLRGVQVADANGKVTFTSIFPGCYSGRWPHIHFEIYPSLAAATSSGNAIRTTQLALPEAACRTVYATSGYTASTTNLNRTSLASDNVFGDGHDWQVATASGDTTNGYTVALTVGVAAAATASPSPAPTGTATTLTLASASGGSAVAGSAAPYAVGQTVALTATPSSGQLFLGWQISGSGLAHAAYGMLAGWANPLNLTLAGATTVTPVFAATKTFSDLTSATTEERAAIAQLAARGIINGYGDGTYSPADPIIRAHVAALIVRAMLWTGLSGTSPFSDQHGVDDDSWKAVAILASQGVAQGYGDGTFGPFNNVSNVQTIAFISRAMVARGYWTTQANNAAFYPNVVAHREDITTYAAYAGAIPGTGSTTATFTSHLDTTTPRAWFALALWQALSSYFGV